MGCRWDGPWDVSSFYARGDIIILILVPWCSNRLNRKTLTRGAARRGTAYGGGPFVARLEGWGEEGGVAPSGQDSQARGP